MVKERKGILYTGVVVGSISNADTVEGQIYWADGKPYILNLFPGSQRRVDDTLKEYELREGKMWEVVPESIKRRTPFKVDDYTPIYTGDIVVPRSHDVLKDPQKNHWFVSYEDVEGNLQVCPGISAELDLKEYTILPIADKIPYNNPALLKVVTQLRETVGLYVLANQETEPDVNKLAYLMGGIESILDLYMGLMAVEEAAEKVESEKVAKVGEDRPY